MDRDWSVCQYSCVNKMGLKKITLVCESRLENFQVQQKSTSEAFAFPQKSNTILGVIFLQSHFTYQLRVSVQISEVFPGLYYHFPWLSLQIKLDCLAKEEVLWIFNTYSYWICLQEILFISFISWGFVFCIQTAAVVGHISE